jgi:hypothetical protein
MQARQAKGKERKSKRAISNWQLAISSAKADAGETG